jgi:RNA polymerase sigma-70 factor (ECF subfamily)
MSVPVEPSTSRSAAEARAIYEEQVGYVWSSLRRLGVLDADREDLCHEVFIVFFRGNGYDPSRPLRPWLFGIAFRVASDHRRRARFRREVAGPVELAPMTGPLADDALQRKEARRIVEIGLEALDLDQRAVFILHEIDGLAMPEIARTLDAPLNTLYSRLRLGRRKFEAAVQRVITPTPPRGVAVMEGR